ncbi:FAD-binding domain protein [Ceratobasidium sp. AG-Ba]|nr:FAD-binding domain protein [Ceratobasidium sp. AG-Ba]
MVMAFLLGSVVSVLSLAYAILDAAPITGPRQLATSTYTDTCKAIANSLSTSAGVYYIGHPLYAKGNAHWASSSSQNSACVIEPANSNDVSIIMEIISNTSTPFGIRSGGHATNPGFSSTPGVQIALFKLNEVTYRATRAMSDGSVGTVEIGAGLVWDDVYAALQPHNVAVVGGRVTGVGVGGFILGGGYSWLSNQYGLTIDTVTAFEVVLPNGTIAIATETTNSDLFFGLKVSPRLELVSSVTRAFQGGLNNFGIVTKFTLLAFPQGKVWGGLRTFTANQIDKINNATVDFVQKVNDSKAAIIIAYNFLLGQLGVSLLMFYDGPTPPAGVFERFTSIPYLSTDISTRTLSSLVRASPANATYGNRGAFNTVSLKTYSRSLINQVANQSESIQYWGKRLAPQANFISYDVEPFLPTMSDRSKGGAYPHDDFLVPLNLYFAWQGSSNDEEFIDAMRESTDLIYRQAVAEGQDVAGAKQIKYPNYAASAESLQSMYGSNMPRLKGIKDRYDPNNVMRLAGGYRF